MKCSTDDMRPLFTRSAHPMGVTLIAPLTRPDGSGRLPGGANMVCSTPRLRYQLSSIRDRTVMAASQQGPVWCPPERQGGQIGQSKGRAADINLAALYLPAQHRGDLEVHEFWRAQPFPAQPGTGTVAVRAVIAEGGGQDRGLHQ